MVTTSERPPIEDATADGSILERFAAVARWSYRHRLAVLAGWLVALVLSAGAYVGLGMSELSPADGFVGESGAAEQLETGSDFLSSRTETILVQGSSAEDSDRIADELSAALMGTAQEPPEKLTAATGDQRVLQVLLPDEQASPSERVQGIDSAIESAREANPGAAISATGPISVQADVTTSYGERLVLLEMLSLPVTAVVLFLVFAGLIATLIPLVTGLAVVALAILWSGPTSLLVPMESNQMSVILLMGLALGVDYSLFFVRRAREEFARSGDADAAATIAVSMTVRSVLVAGLVTGVSVIAAFLTESPIFHSLTLGIILVVVAAMLASITLLPALLALGRRRVVRQLFGKTPDDAAEETGFWGRLSGNVVRRPMPALLAGLAVMVLLAAPVATMKLQFPGTDSMPRTFETLRTLDDVSEQFPLYGVSHTVVTETGGDVAGASAVLTDIAEAAAGLPGFDGQVRDVQISTDRSVARIEIGTDSDGIDAQAAKDSLNELRSNVVPEFAGGRDILVGGETAVSVDVSQSTSRDLLIVIPIVLLVAFALIYLAFRSVGLAALSVGLNLLSVLASYGILVLLFQYGWGATVFGSEYVGPVVTLLPVMMLVILIGLSMDYHVFILTRVREAFGRGLGVEDAVRQGVVRSAPPVTAAAAVMVVIFAMFTLLPTPEMKQLGVGLAAAIALDATVVRGILVPAALRLLGASVWKRSLDGAGHH
ncbi:hypothetical protein CH276_12995 [Rhodococcus sp. 06-470-2]|uniref:MMPL family transporter n=1 Tax=Nocardiaceae TaxID=85025 RepID=UPI00050C884B|nr:MULTISPECIES: MMPL family transporter [Rhodococcus]OZC63268.1 hypothetical protein CH276_12995 [Rhodococcus sp. 06-470-2]OZD82107.1 hypothetical protein CH273_09790 [Rhodococcus sp. 05-339-2]OZE05091.1 hypothetical protein CH250_19945 [Rhodococcus sp. 05-2255-3C]OZE11731.1 hypothetical protein CH249_09630 [Rhodococcus sp. 05-2255-3B1]OZE24138.1 hypothetical protein CH255_02135 [Rhodococcus sp. 05-2255-2A2]